MPFLAKEHHPIPTKDILSWIFDDAKYDPDDAIYIDGLSPTRSISARQARKLIRQIAAGLHAIGLRPGDCACMHSFNDILYPIFFLGLIAAGGVFAGTNPGYTPFELAHTLRVAKVKYVFSQPDLLTGLLKAAEQSNLPKDRIIVFNPNGAKAPSGLKQWSDILSHGEVEWPRFNDLETCRSTAAARLFSSGTTGLPKATELSHYNLIAQHTLVYEANPRPWRVKKILSLPMFHAAAAPSVFCSFLRDGAQGIVFPRFEPETWLKAHEQFSITDINVVPPMVVIAVNHPLRKKYSMKSVRLGNSGAAPLDRLLQARMQELIGNEAPLTQVWGMTETSCIATRFPYPHTDTTGSVGWPLPNLDTKLVDDDGNDISAFDLRGELCIRGPTVVSGYFENPEANARDWDADGYFHTGDVAYVDGKTGLYYIVDRKKVVGQLMVGSDAEADCSQELIKVRAFQVAPAELEGVLLDHPDIVDAAVIGVPDPANKDQSSELPRAYVVIRPGRLGQVSTEAIHAHIQERLASYKMIAGGIVFANEIPKNASGKILKRVLRERAAQEMGDGRTSLAAKL